MWHPPSPSPHTAPAFVPCVEDAPYARLVGRRPPAFQRTLDAASYAFLVAQSRYTRAVRGGQAAPTARAAYEAALREHYATLWQDRGQVPKPARREWLETAMVYLDGLHALEVGLLWLVDAHGKRKEEAAEDTTSRPGPSTAAQGTDAPPRKQPKGKHANMKETAPLWYLWQDTQRHVHHLTLRLHAWTPAAGGAYATREALRMSDLLRMDSAAFTWRVRLWSRVSQVVLDDTQASASSVAAAEAVHASFSTTLRHRLNGTASSFPEEEPELFDILTALCATSERRNGNSSARVQIAGALRYRMFIEVMLGRLRRLPRCIFTWYLLRDMLKQCLRSADLTAADPGSPAVASAQTHPHAAERHKEDEAVLEEMAVYIDAVLIPYLEGRDCHLGNVRHTATAIHARFTAIATAQLAALQHALAGVAAAQGVLLAASASADADSGGALEDSDGIIATEQRDKMAALMGDVLRRVCVYDCDERQQQQQQGAPLEVVTLNILADEGNNGSSVTGARAETSEASLDDALSEEQRFYRMPVDERLLCSEAARTSQLALFFQHYFTQCPTFAFDRPRRTGDGATGAPSLVAEGEA